MSARRYVATYHEDRCYGGPEEGGWYYTEVELVGYQYCGSNRKAKEQFCLQQEDMEPRYFLRIETAATLGQEDNTE